MANKHIPIRTCVGCRKTFAQARLVRFVREAAGWTADAANLPRRPGRGAYLCSAECAGRAAKNRRYPGLASAAAEYGLISSSVHHETPRE